MRGGYIKLYRQIAENPIWLIKPFSEGQAWVDLLCITTFDKGFIKTKNGQIIELTVGDCGYSQLSLSERWGWSRGKVKRFILLLEKQKMIQQKKYDKLTIINILNYEKYQSRTTNDTTNGQQTIQQTIQQTDTINNDKNDKNDKKTIYGEYGHVRLTDQEKEKLLNAYGQQMTDDAIRFLDEYIEMKGYKAKSHYLCIKKWVVDAVKRSRNKIDDTYEMMRKWAEEGE